MDPLNIPVYPNEIISLDKSLEYFEDILVFDVGAFRGLWSLVALESGAKHVVAFEPDPIEDLARNLSKFVGKYRCINAFVTDEEHLDEDDNFRTTIDRFVTKQRYNQLGFIKIDVEGDEMEVLTGGGENNKEIQTKFND